MMQHAPSKGFTLVETLVAISIIVMAVVGPLYAVQQSLEASRIARDRLVAASLAQEGMEFARAIRDGNYLYNVRYGTARSWLRGLDGTDGTANCRTGCAVDPVENAVYQGATPAPLAQDATGRYLQVGGSIQTPFIRTLHLQQVSATEAEVTVRVTWSTRGFVRQVEVVERLTNWL